MHDDRWRELITKTLLKSSTDIPPYQKHDYVLTPSSMAKVCYDWRLTSSEHTKISTINGDDKLHVLHNSGIVLYNDYAINMIPTDELTKIFSRYHNVPRYLHSINDVWKKEDKWLPMVFAPHRFVRNREREKREKLNKDLKDKAKKLQSFITTVIKESDESTASSLTEQTSSKHEKKTHRHLSLQCQRQVKKENCNKIKV